jgi:hypothetical protein
VAICRAESSYLLCCGDIPTAIPAAILCKHDPIRTGTSVWPGPSVPSHLANLVLSPFEPAAQIQYIGDVCAGAPQTLHCNLRVLKSN